MSVRWRGKPQRPPGSCQQELRVATAVTSVVVKCAEAVWWRCHRQIIAD